MARDLFRIEKGMGIEDVNGNGLVEFLSGTSVPSGTGDQASAPIGSLYIRSGTGELYQKITNSGNSADWELNGSSSGVISRWRNEQVYLSTGDTLSAGSLDVTTLTDLESVLVVGDAPVGGYITDGAGNLWEITANGLFPTITIAAGGTAPVEGDAFITKKYLVDSPANQENQAGLLYTSGSYIKIFDIDWDFATGINLSSGYSAQNGSITNADSVESAVEKLDGNQQDLTTLSGVAQGSVDLGTFTGITIPDSQTVKQALQSLETAHEEVDQNVNDLITLSGRPENSVNQGLMDQGDILSDNATNNSLFKEVDAELTRQRGKTSALGVTAESTIDSVLVDNVSQVVWHVTIENAASPANKRIIIVHAGHDGHSAADATSVDDNISSQLKLGSNFNRTVTVDINGVAGAQEMRLRIASTEPSGVNVYAKRIETLF